jgi:hypothetical protein
VGICIVLSCHQYIKFGGSNATLPNKITARDVRLMRNEIYARHGYIFTDNSLDKYFRLKTWYKPNPQFKQSMLSEHEKGFISKLLNVEQELK